MRSRTLREGSVGLLILVGMGLFTGLIFWLRGLNPGTRAYNLEIELADAAGIEVGSTVRYRGVKVGTVTSMQTSTNSARVIATITPGTLMIPRQSIVETTQSGFIGQVFLDFRPPAVIPVVDTSAQSPFRPACNTTLFYCDGDKLKGNVGANFDQLIRATTTIADSLQQSKLIDLASQTLITADSTLKRFDQTAVVLAGTAKDIRLLSQDARGQFKNLAAASTSVTTAANQMGTAANEVTSLVRANRGTITASLKNLDQAGDELKVAITNLRPFLNRLEESKLLANLESLAENGSAAAANLKGLSGNLNNPITLLGLVQTLDAARVTFLNTQKITADLQKVTGDVNFSKNLLNLLRGLSKLVSSSQELERQLQALQVEAVQVQNPTSVPLAPAATSPSLTLLYPTVQPQSLQLSPAKPSPKISFNSFASSALFTSSPLAGASALVSENLPTFSDTMPALTLQPVNP